MKKTLEYYMGLPYTIKLIRDPNPEDPGWVARVVELPGCITQGDTLDELEEMIADAMRGWIAVAIEEGLPVPEPMPIQEYSGKFVVRVPKSLHRELVEAAEKDGVSLNAFVNVALGKAVGRSMVTYPALDQSSAMSVPNWHQVSENPPPITTALKKKVD